MPESSPGDSKLQIEVAVFSEVGRRPENQDWMSWSRIPWGECYIVADGMGGYKGGALAARMTVEGLERYLKAQPADLPFEQVLQDAIRQTNQEVYSAAQSGGPETDHMGSTVAIALISGNQLQVGHIGDSRIYFLHRRRLRLLTTDHTSVQRMVDSGMITEGQAREHPDAHILSRAIGSKPDVEIEIGKPIPLEDGDGVLLCSDGLSAYMESSQIEKIVRSASDVQRIPKRLVESALKCGSDDNITVQFVRYGNPVVSKRRHTAKLSPVLPFRSSLSGLVQWFTLALALALVVAAALVSQPQVKTWLAERHRSTSPANASPTPRVSASAAPFVAGAPFPKRVAVPSPTAATETVAASPATVTVIVLARSDQEESFAKQIITKLGFPEATTVLRPNGNLGEPPSNCFIFYSDASLGPAAQQLQEKLTKMRLTCCQAGSAWKYGLYKNTALRQYVQTKIPEKHLLIAFPKQKLSSRLTNEKASWD